jgi:L-malate glycosyltransferase
MQLSLRKIAIPRRPPSQKPISVCFVIDKLSRAGTESQLLELIRQLDRRRVVPSLCLLHPEDEESLSLRPVECPTLSLGMGRILSPSALGGAGRLAAFWRKNRVEVVQTYFKDSTYFAAPLARLCGIRHVVRVRNNVGYWLTPSHKLLGRFISRLGTTLTNSENARQAIVDAEGIHPSRVSVIPNGVDPDRFRNLEPPDTSRAIVRIGAVANLRPVKNIDGLIRAAGLICKDDPRVEFHVAGEGEQRERLEHQIRTEGLAERFFMHGSAKDVPQFLGSLDVAVICSHSESMSNALLEYMAAGRAIVATDVGANATLIRHEVDGLIVPPKDDSALERSIRRFVEDPECGKRCGSAARERAVNEFGRQSMVRRFEDFFASLVK